MSSLFENICKKAVDDGTAECYNINMNTKRWLKKHTHDLTGVTVAITGPTGGLGTELCHYLAALNASLILLDRNPARSALLREQLQVQFPGLSLHRIPLDLSDMDSVRAACEQLKALPIDILIHNAGAYSIPRYVCDTGLDNVFQINCAAPYYLTKELLPLLRQRKGHVVAVSSIAHTYAETNPDDVDFSTRPQARLVYGNAKRRLTFSLAELFRHETDATLAIVHPGITFTNITAHYPPWLFALIKHPMKLIFMKPSKAALCLLAGVFSSGEYGSWIGPRVFNIWGLPRKQPLRTVSAAESRRIAVEAEDTHRRLTAIP